MKNFLRFNTRAAVLGAVVTTVAMMSPVAQAGVINNLGGPLTANGITFSNISENVSKYQIDLLTNAQTEQPLTPGTTFYGTPTVTSSGGTALVFQPTGDFFVKDFVPNQESFLHAVLHFTATFTDPTILNAIVHEGGAFSIKGSDGYTDVVGRVVVREDGNSIPGALLNVVFDDPSNTWTGTATVSSTTAGTVFKFDIDNDLSAGRFTQVFGPQIVASGSGFVPNSSFIDKKFFEIDFPPTGGGSLPEPASLGILGVGAAGLIAHRRR